jgi:hypothetical protein
LIDGSDKSIATASDRNLRFGFFPPSQPPHHNLHMASSSKAAPVPSQQEIVATFKSMRMDLQRMAQKIGDLEAERDEHRYIPASPAHLVGWYWTR